MKRSDIWSLVGIFLSFVIVFHDKWWPTAPISTSQEYEISLNRWRSQFGMAPVLEEMSFDQSKNREVDFRRPVGQLGQEPFLHQKAIFWEESGQRKAEQDFYRFLEGRDTVRLFIQFSFESFRAGQNPVLVELAYSSEFDKGMVEKNRLEHREAIEFMRGREKEDIARAWERYLEE